MQGPIGIGERLILQAARVLGVGCLLARKEVRNESQVDFALPPGWDNYMLRWFDVVVTGVQVNNQLRVSQDGGATFLATAADYTWAGQRLRADGTVVSFDGVGSADNDNIRLTYRSEDRSYGEAKMFCPMRPGSFKRLISFSSVNDEAIDHNRFTGFGFLSVNSNPWNAIRFRSGTTITRGTFELYALGRMT